MTEKVHGLGKQPSYYAAPVSEERLRPVTEKFVALGYSYEAALAALRALCGEPVRPFPRYFFTIDRKVIRRWGKPLLHKGKKRARG